VDPGGKCRTRRYGTFIVDPLQPGDEDDDDDDDDGDDGVEGEWAQNELTMYVSVSSM